MAMIVNIHPTPTCALSVNKVIRYFTNWMGPISHAWCSKHGDGWSIGRIDVYGTDDEYPVEIPLPMMESTDWMSFSNWLYNVTTETVHTLEQLVEEYQKNHRPIKWFVSDKCPRCDQLGDNGAGNWCSKCEVEVFAVGGG